jgi:hypothetical protein
MPSERLRSSAVFCFGPYAAVSPYTGGPTPDYTPFCARGTAYGVTVVGPASRCTSAPQNATAL